MGIFLGGHAIRTATKTSNVPINRYATDTRMLPPTGGSADNLCCPEGLSSANAQIAAGDGED
jgi:hypothetical protein